MIRRMSWFSHGRSIFSQDNYNLINFVTKCQSDQAYLNSTYKGLTGDFYDNGKIRVLLLIGI